MRFRTAWAHGADGGCVLWIWAALTRVRSVCAIFEYTPIAIFTTRANGLGAGGWGFEAGGWELRVEGWVEVWV